MKTFRLLTALTLGTLLWGCAESGKKAEGPFYTDIESRAQLHDWFRTHRSVRSSSAATAAAW